MTPLLIGLVLFAAVLHASWNAMVKSSGRPEYSIAGFQVVGSLICLCLAPFVALPDRPSWPMIAASVLIHNVYYLTLAQSYRAGDLSQVYPILRGLAPVLVTVGAGVFASEWLPIQVVAGIVVISIGIMSLAFSRHFTGAMPRSAVLWGLVTALLIAAYTVVDGIGVRRTEQPLSYIVWLFIFEPLPICLWLLLKDKKDWLNQLSRNARVTIIGGCASSLAYGLVIFAMSLGAMGIVSSLRETSVIFAAIIGSVYLKEDFGKQRIVAAILVSIGIVFLNFH